MRETTPVAMPPCFEKWCRRFDDGFKTKAQKTGLTNVAKPELVKVFHGLSMIQDIVKVAILLREWEGRTSEKLAKQITG
jgi:hypothetical protein